ncbi:hypothetical protein [Streptomyces sp. BK239]|uniref:hypothetical protein n=1 Tax=Streptomyces sp. BK239 TaxID=2512155 RepID=UPI00102C6986|nr:hypothetical protein [Streptomyces sp. BK239]RZU25677.1 hypothetical protein EV567_1167 [Streptomyces sp. BK239]
MSAHTQTRPHPAAQRGGVGALLPWWALALPVLAFVGLLLLIINPSDAHAATDDPVIAQLAGHVRQLLVR